eukprot:Awhi_evm2s10337
MASTISSELKFDDIKISTTTVIGVTNVNIDIARVFRELPVTPIPEQYHSVVNKLRKRTTLDSDKVKELSQYLEDGNILTIKYNQFMRSGICQNGETIVNHKTTVGSSSSSNKATVVDQAAQTETYFRNTLTLVIVVDGVIKNVKIFTAKREGAGSKTQHPGCKSIEEAQLTMQYLWNHISKLPDIFTFTTIMEDSPNEFCALFHTVMTNINFNTGFRVNRKKLDQYMNANTKYNSLLHPNFGHTGVNITDTLDWNPEEIIIPRMKYHEDGTVVDDMVGFETYLGAIDNCDREVKRLTEHNIIVDYQNPE